MLFFACSGRLAQARSTSLTSPAAPPPARRRRKRLEGGAAVGKEGGFFVAPAAARREAGPEAETPRGGEPDPLRPPPNPTVRGSAQPPLVERIRPYEDGLEA